MVLRHAREPFRLAISGRVRTPLALSPEEAAALPAEEARVPGRKGRPDAVGTGFRLRHLLEEAGAEGAWATCSSADGFYTASIPVDVLARQGVVMLTPDGPSPWRLVVPDGDTLCWNVKGLVSIEITDEKRPDSVPEVPPH
jgi:DMSO/TMAO reductase YedYZ molybdopterin-dependent catalytic subunit